jgi:HEAT repeat protein
VKRGWRIVLIVAVCAVVAIVTALVWPGEKEPVYQGKKLSEWLVNEQPDLDVGGRRKLQAEAIGQIGTNALPWLLKWANHEHAPRVNRFAVLARRLHVNLYSGTGDEERASAAWMWLQILGPKAAPGIPALFQMATNSRTPDVAWSASAELGYIGPEALPALLAIATNRQAPARGQAIVSMGAIRNLGTNANLVVPVLMKLVQHNVGVDQGLETSLRRYAIQGLGSFRQAALPAVPQLIEAMNDKDFSVRDAVTNALREIAPEVLGKAGAGGERN